MNILAKNLRYWTRDRLGHSRLGYRLLGRTDQFRHRRVREDTAILIDGFPRSGNSFFLNYFRHWNPGVSAAHHMHVPQQLVEAARCSIPAVLLVREPVDAIASVLVVEPMSITIAVRSYASYYEKACDYAAHCVVAEFDEVVETPGHVIDAVNQRFGSNFAPGVLDEALGETLFEKLRRHHISQDQQPGLVATPDSAKRARKTEVLGVLERHPDLARARSAFERFRMLGRSMRAVAATNGESSGVTKS